MITAAYTICKNEINRVEQWVHYTKDFDYRVILDTGSTDGTYEAFKKVPGIIIDQYLVNPDEWRFDIPRNINLNMIPKEVDWALSPDVDEYFSINVLEEMEKIIKQDTSVNNISCARLDIYSKEVFVGKPKHIGTNKIHRRHQYVWKQPIYEYLSYTEQGNENEHYSDKIFLIHDQEINKPRGTLYMKLMQKEYKENPKNSWNSWFLCNEYYRNQDLENFVQVGLDYVAYGNRSEGKWKEVVAVLNNISNSTNVDEAIRKNLRTRLFLIGAI